MNEMNAKEQLVDNLMKTSSQLFKFHGEVAMQLFLNDELKLPSIVEICVERKRLSDIVKVIPQSYALLYIDKQDQAIAKEDLSLSKIAKVYVQYDDTTIMSIFVYDVVNDEWIFRLDPNICIPKSNIYFHSLNWDVDYIKPEIVLMYDLMQHHQYHHYSNYKRVIDALSYYQFFILKFVVGEQRIKDAIQRTINN